MTCPAIGTEHQCPKIGTEKECLIDGQLCSSIKQVPLKEVDIHLLGEIPGKVQNLSRHVGMKLITSRVQRTQIHSFAVGDNYELLPKNKDPDIDDWKVSDIRGHIRESKEIR